MMSAREWSHFAALRWALRLHLTRLHLLGRWDLSMGSLNGISQRDLKVRARAPALGRQLPSAEAPRACDLERLRGLYLCHDEAKTCMALATGSSQEGLTSFCE